MCQHMYILYTIRKERDDAQNERRVASFVGIMNIHVQEISDELTAGAFILHFSTHRTYNIYARFMNMTIVQGHTCA